MKKTKKELEEELKALKTEEDLLDVRDKVRAKKKELNDRKYNIVVSTIKNFFKR